MTSTTKSLSLLAEANDPNTSSDRLREISLKERLPTKVLEALASNPALPTDRILTMIGYGGLRQILDNPAISLAILADPALPQRIGAVLETFYARVLQEAANRSLNEPAVCMAIWHDLWEKPADILQNQPLPHWIHQIMTAPEGSVKFSNLWELLANNPHVSTTGLLSCVPLTTLICSLRDRGYSQEDHFKIPFLQRADLPTSFWLEALQVGAIGNARAKNTQATIHLPSVINRMPTPFPPIPNSENWRHAVSPVQWIEAISQDHRFLDFFDEETRAKCENDLRILYRMGIVNPEWKFPAYIIESSNTPYIWHHMLESARRIGSWSFWNWSFSSLLDRAIIFRSLELDQILANQVRKTLDYLSQDELALAPAPVQDAALNIIQQMDRFERLVAEGTLRPSLAPTLPEQIRELYRICERLETLMPDALRDEENVYRASIVLSNPLDPTPPLVGQPRIRLKESQWREPIDITFRAPFRTELIEFLRNAKIPTTPEQCGLILQNLIRLSDNPEQPF